MVATTSVDPCGWTRGRQGWNLQQHARMHCLIWAICMYMQSKLQCAVRPVETGPQPTVCTCNLWKSILDQHMPPVVPCYPLYGMADHTDLSLFCSLLPVAVILHARAKNTQSIYNMQINLFNCNGACSCAPMCGPFGHTSFLLSACFMWSWDTNARLWHMYIHMYILIHNQHTN